MQRFVAILSMMSVAALAAAPAVAQQKPMAMSCDKMIAQIRDAAGNRFDSASWEARGKAEAAEKAHKDGKPADCEKMAKEGLTLLGIAM
jgi:hypothetical protein